MATTDTELKKLNKNVDDAVKILKIAYGNSAQASNMNDKQKEAIDKLLKVGEIGEDELKKQRKFTERQRDESGKFLKKKEKDEKNTSNKFLSLAQSLGGIIKSSFGGVVSTAQKAWGGLTTHFRNFFSQLKSQFLSLFGEESEWFAIIGSLKDSVMGFFGWIKGGVMSLIGKTPKWAKKQLDYLKGMYTLQLAEYKKNLLGDGVKGKKFGFLGMIATAVIIGVAFLAAYIKKKILLFIKAVDILKAMGLGKFMEAVKMKFPRIFGEKGFIGKILKALKWIEKIPGIGWIVKGLRLGFTKLFVPLTIIMGVIDFVKGFMNTKGDLLDKIVGGIKTVLMSFLEFPAYALGWVIEKMMGWLGLGEFIPEGGLGNKFVELVSGFLDFYYDFIKDGLRKAGAFLGDMGNTVGEWFKDFHPLQAIKDFIQLLTDMFTNMVEYIKGSRILSKLFGVEYSETPTYKPMPKVDLTDYTSAHERRKIELQNQKDEGMQKKIEESTMATKEAAEVQKQSTAIIANTNNQSGGGTQVVESKQIPDELDNNMINFKNTGWEMGS